MKYLLLGSRYLILIHMQFTKAKTDFLEYLEIEQNRSQKTIRNYDVRDGLQMNDPDDGG